MAFIPNAFICVITRDTSSFECYNALSFHTYSPFHPSLPFEHLGQSSLCVNQITFYSILELKQCPRCQVSKVRGVLTIQHLSLGNDDTSSDKNIVIVLLKKYK